MVLLTKYKVLKQINQTQFLSGILKVVEKNGAITHKAEEIQLKDVSIIKEGQSFAFIMETKLCSADVELARKADLLVAELTFKAECEDKAIRFGHITVTQAAQRDKEADARTPILTHFYQRYSRPNDDFETEARKVFPNTIRMKDKKSYILERPKRLV